MRIIQILSSLALVSLVASSPTSRDVSILSNTKSVRTARSTTPDKKTCPQTHGSNVTIISGSATYLLTVPADKTQHTVVGKDQELGCVGPLGDKYSMCTDCTIPVNGLEVSADAGICAFNISSYTTLLHHDHKAGLLSLTPPGQVFQVTCGLIESDLPGGGSLPTRDTTPACSRPVNSSAVQCSSGTYTITLKDNQGPHTTHVSNDQTFFADPSVEHLFVNHATLSCGCQNDSSECFQCGQVYTSIIVNDDELGYCSITTSDTMNSTGILLSKVDGEHKFQEPTGIQVITCGINNYPTNMTRSIRKRTEPQSPPQRQEPALTPRNISVSSLCTTTTPYNVALTTSDSNIYFAPIPLDLQAHWLQDLSCIRVSDAACIPCSQIGSVTGVSTKIDFGPCVFFTEDHRSACTAYVDGSVIPGQSMGPVVVFEPAGVISGIECGTGC